MLRQTHKQTSRVCEPTYFYSHQRRKLVDAVSRVIPTSVVDGELGVAHLLVDDLHVKEEVVRAAHHHDLALVT